MEWIIGSLFVPVVIFLWQIYRERRKDLIDNESRFSDIEIRVSLQEQKIISIENDISEIDKLIQDITELKINVARILTILEERDR